MASGPRPGRRNLTAADSQELADAFVTESRALISVAVRPILDAPVDVTVAQHRVLVLLAARGDLTVGDIAGGLGVNPSNATRYCDSLQPRSPRPDAVVPGAPRSWIG
ncbi:MarR family transcriptional regulator [Nocardioides sp. HB32]